MMSMTTTAGNHLIEIEFSIWSGLEQIKCDDVVVSKKKSWFYTTPHFFVLQEAGEEVTYEVNVLTGWMGLGYGYIVRRNGVILACKP